MVLRHLVPHNWSPIDWSLWTNGPQPIWTNGPQKFGPLDKWSPKIWSPGQMVPNQFGPPGQMVHRTFLLSRGTDCGVPEIWGPNLLGTICPGGPNIWYHLSMGIEFDRDHLSRGINFIGIICPGGQEVRGLEVWGSNGLGPNASQPKCYLILAKKVCQLAATLKKHIIFKKESYFHSFLCQK